MPHVVAVDDLWLLPMSACCQVFEVVQQGYSGDEILGFKAYCIGKTIGSYQVACIIPHRNDRHYQHCESRDEYNSCGGCLLGARCRHGANYVGADDRSIVPEHP